ncbi:hypothetical protein [Chitinophaga pinensis]|uniref:Uncharacterized protein n=1 Tax=Chitinophaga pinensis TaxID=79329 RepID=A0A5C6LX10_9BACT|nr:hypothetical protein [Chitinophaga pinensis]TWW01110.1 hypothetical protein FEF09_06475 [Chitinophaga pinensis]
MSVKKLIAELSPEELVDSFVFPVRLNKKQKQEAAEQLAAARKKSQSATSEEDKLILGLLRLKFQIETYIKSEKYDHKLSFGYFLKEYVSLLQIKRKLFAEELSIDETLLSQLINQKRDPPEYLMVRLEIHSNNAIPADYWFRVMESAVNMKLKPIKNYGEKRKNLFRINYQLLSDITLL